MAKSPNIHTVYHNMAAAGAFDGYEHQEYPKWVEGPAGPVVVDDEDEEAEVLQAKADADAASAADPAKAGK